MAATEDRVSKPTHRLTTGMMYAVAFALAFGVGTRAFDPLSVMAVDTFEIIARAQYKMHLASQNLNADGQAEYAVLLTNSDAVGELVAWANGEGDLQVRDAAIPGWQVVSVPPERGQVVANTLREQSFSRAVLRNRGMWICH